MTTIEVTIVEVSMEGHIAPGDRLMIYQGRVIGFAGDKRPTSDGRSERGAVRDAIARVLSVHVEGLNEADIMSRVEGCSPRSVGGELRRMRGKVYDQVGTLWRLKA